MDLAITVIMSSGDYIFSVNLAVMVITSSGDYIFMIYDMVITGHHVDFASNYEGYRTAVNILCLDS